MGKIWIRNSKNASTKCLGTSHLGVCANVCVTAPLAQSQKMCTDAKFKIWAQGMWLKGGKIVFA